MKTYFIEINGEQQGPFTLDELKAKQVKAATKVWTEGLEDWVEAQEIEELKRLVIGTMPPPLNKDKERATVVLTSTDGQHTEPVVAKPKRKLFLMLLIAGSVLLVGILSAGFYQYAVAVSGRLEEQNLQLSAQQAQIAEQERIEAERKAEEERKRQEAVRKQREERLAALRLEYDHALNQLRFAKTQLDEIRQFKLLRTRSEKESQMQAQIEAIRRWENEVDRLNGEMGRY